MAWAPVLDSRPPKPMAVLWLLGLWVPLLWWTGAIALDDLSAVGSVPASDLARFLVGAVTALIAGVEAAALAFTWLWLWIAVPLTGRRSSLWIATSLVLAAASIGQLGPGAGSTAASVLLALVAGIGVYAVIATRIRARRVWRNIEV